MDDYGTGYCRWFTSRTWHSTKSRLIARSLPQSTPTPQNAAIVRSTIELGHSLGMMVIAEASRQAEPRHLQAFGCDYAQGYRISRPIPADDIPRWMAARQRRVT